MPHAEAYHSSLFDSFAAYAATLRRVSHENETNRHEVRSSEPIMIEAESSNYVELEFDDKIVFEVLQVWTGKYLNASRLSKSQFRLFFGLFLLWNKYMN